MNLRMKFKCLKCGTEVEFGPGAITLKCQSCDGYDLAFDQDVIRTPIFAGDRGETEFIKKDQPALGRHNLGYIPNIWEIIPAEYEITGMGELTKKVEQEFFEEHKGPKLKRPKRK